MVITWLGLSLGKLLTEVEPHRGLVDGHPLARLLARQAADRGRAAGERQIRALRDAARPGADARPARPLVYLAVRRGAAAGRGDAPAGDPQHRPLRQGAP